MRAILVSHAYVSRASRAKLRALNALGRAARAIGEDDEAVRCATFLRDSSPSAADLLS